MKKTRDMTEEEWKEKNKKMIEIQGLLMEFFEINEIPPIEAVDAMVRLLVLMFSERKATKKELEKLFNYILIASTRQE